MDDLKTGVIPAEALRELALEAERLHEQIAALEASAQRERQLERSGGDAPTGRVPRLEDSLFEAASPEPCPGIAFDSGPVLLQDLAREVKRLRDEVDRWRGAALSDPLTQISNRRAFEERYQLEAERAQRYKRPVSLIAFDLDGFKAYNDTYGHEAGDAVLKAFAEVLRCSIRSSDAAFRLGGDEFVLLLPETDLEGANVCAGHVEERWRFSSAGRGGILMPSSWGVASFPETESCPAELYAQADAALYKMKRSRKSEDTWPGRLVASIR